MFYFQRELRWHLLFTHLYSALQCVFNFQEFNIITSKKAKKCRKRMHKQQVASGLNISNSMKRLKKRISVNLWIFLLLWNKKLRQLPLHYIHLNSSEINLKLNLNGISIIAKLNCCAEKIRSSILLEFRTKRGVIR